MSEHDEFDQAVADLKGELGAFRQALRELGAALWAAPMVLGLLVALFVVSVWLVVR